VFQVAAKLLNEIEVIGGDVLQHHCKWSFCAGQCARIEVDKCSKHKVTAALLFLFALIDKRSDHEVLVLFENVEQ
jgi:hypothetical protein